MLSASKRDRHGLADGDRDGLVILEPEAEGHAQEWLQHLVDFVAAGGDVPAPVWIVGPATLCAVLAKSMPPSAIGRVRLVALSPLEHRLCTHRRLWISAFARWRTMRRHLNRTCAKSGFFLSLDHLSLPLALGLGTGGKPVSGILFRPSVHYGEFGAYRPSAVEKVRDLRKDLLYRLMLRNRDLATVLSLDPFFALHAASRYAQGAKVRPLPDPAFPPPADLDMWPVDPEAQSPDRVSFLLFGHLTERKGLLALLDALALLKPSLAARIAVTFAGRVDPVLRQPLELRRRSLLARHPEIWLRVEDRRLGATELAALVRRSDVILAPYQRFVGSSGVLLWAAREGRPLLVQDYGLIGRLTRDHRLGLVADCGNPKSLAAGIARMVEHGPDSFVDKCAARAYAAAHTPQVFASIVMRSAFATG
ncbi:MAG: glycosyltransferase [Lysobacterales bacterium]